MQELVGVGLLRSIGFDLRNDKWRRGGVAVRRRHVKEWRGGVDEQ